MCFIYFKGIFIVLIEKSDVQNEGEDRGRKILITRSLPSWPHGPELSQSKPRSLSISAVSQGSEPYPTAFTGHNHGAGSETEQPGCEPL